MKIHVRPPILPMPPAPPPKPPSTAIEIEMQTEELTWAARQQRSRLKKLYGAQKSLRDLDEDTDPEGDESSQYPNRYLDFLA